MWPWFTPSRPGHSSETRGGCCCAKPIDHASESNAESKSGIDIRALIRIWVHAFRLNFCRFTVKQAVQLFWLVVEEGRGGRAPVTVLAGARRPSRDEASEDRQQLRPRGRAQCTFKKGSADREYYLDASLRLAVQHSFGRW